MALNPELTSSYWLDHLMAQCKGSSTRIWIFLIIYLSKKNSDAVEKGVRAKKTKGSFLLSPSLHYHYMFLGNCPPTPPLSQC